MAIIGGEVLMVSPKTMTPSTIPAAGSPALMPGSDACNSDALNALCISQSPTSAAPTRLYAGQLVSSAMNEWWSSILTVWRVRASEMPNTSPAAAQDDSSGHLGDAQPLP